MARGAYILGCEGTTLSDAETRFFKEANPWGFILFARNLDNPEQTYALCDQLRDAVGWDAPILIDQEGGRVERMGPPHWRHWMPAFEQARIAGPRSFELRYQLIALELRAAGIDVNCAPLCDVATPDTHPVLHNRCYGEKPAHVALAARAVVNGLTAGGVLPVVKHMPGHGRSTLDTHLDLPRVAAARDTLDQHDFAPFKALNDVGMGMTCHLIFEAFDPQSPATQSPIMVDVIRNDVGFDGLLMTDDISMEALSGSVGMRGALSLKAGCDVVLHCNGKLAEMEEIAALGELSAAAQTRATRALAQRKRPDEVDIPSLEREFLALVPGGFNV